MCVKYRVTASVRWWGFMGRIPSTCACARCRGTGSTRELHHQKQSVQCIALHAVLNLSPYT
eukprot:scaffold191762_cov26-Tisochrysis_lutea.AAC.3